jgi:hypothetical protein
LIIHFPTGQAFPARLSGWFWLLLLFSVLAGLPLVIAPGLSSYILVATIVITGLVPFLALISLILRYRAAGIAERMQIKWLVWYAGVAVAVSIGMSFFPASTKSQAAWIAKITGFIFWQAFPAAG